MQQTPVQKFCKILRKRSDDHKKAMVLVSRIPNVAVSILRMELDTMVRTIYLLSIADIDERNRLIGQTLSNRQWTSITENGKEKKITDKDMVNRATQFQRWALLVYKFGCSFIHLTNNHNYSMENPLDLIDENDKRNIFHYMRQYHGGPRGDKPSFEEFAFYFPMIFEKITGNLECYIRGLENEEILEVIL